jgi:glycine cleavage system H lipoate-binding protein
MTVLFVILTIILLLGLDWVIQRVKREKGVGAAQPAQTAATPYPVRTPEGVFFAKSHTWMNLFPSGRIRLGVDDFVGSLMENPSVVFLKGQGDSIEKGEPILRLEDGEHLLTIRAPLSGEVLALNIDLEKSPNRMREALFSEGWAYTVRPRSLQDLRGMLLGTESRSWMFEELRRLREMLTGTAAGQLATAYIQDGGAPSPGVFKQLDRAHWQQLEEQFLQVR